ncbi:restriction endonuclease subunit S [Vibrio vulnificus]|uniref:restriction endonuclease subunit S n=1 Tax=Vibrio vulnificus TaxID=672 RepID=UPI001F5DE90E|nr:restriction endonuclease subunit S [Vibrio vulnificus]
MESITDMPKYESYKKSGVEYVGCIPKYWNISKLKFLARIFTGDSISPSLKDKLISFDESERPYISSKDINVHTSGIDYDNGIRIPIDSKQFKVAPVQSSLLCIEGGSAGKKIAFTDHEVCFVNKLACFKSSKISNKYIFYSLFSSPFQTQFKLSMSGLIGGVSISSINNFVITVPPKEEQLLIVKYLDKKTSQLDEAISVKEQQISLLRERKRVIIRQAITQGIKPGVLMKDCGVDWIGTTPKHWKVVRFKNLFSQSRLPVRKGDGVVTSYRDGQVTLRANRRLDGYTEAILEGGYQGIRKGQLVLNSMDAFEGAIGVSDSDGKCTPEYVVCDPIRNDISPYYFALLLREMALSKYIQVICNAVRQRAVRIRFNNLATRFMIVPPKSEQDAIVRHIDTETSKIDVAIGQLNHQINKLKEFKTTLINSAVTGKIRITPEMAEG